MTYLVAAAAAMFSLWVVLVVRFFLRAMLRGVSTRMAAPADPVALRRERRVLLTVTLAAAATVGVCAAVVLGS